MLRFIGVVEHAEEKGVARIRIFDEFRDGLEGLDTYSHVIVLYWFHLRDTEEERNVLKVVPRRHPGAPEVGVFTSRSPSRPNPIGLCVTELVRLEGNMLSVKGLDAFDGTPILDIKPYNPRADSVPDAVVPPWALRGPKT
ncbi:MAG TPA: tRNA (N6-threonylcarbamoyladenosine(37)-N6)-methyltransferase TrmO [Desulfobacteria bacterium]|nr:tRNA (N6-threonylcarbamoyladenosine(37)-N6)-methyltransferase TrmO [Desulfobacteria bacterium]